jgi:hypothetical protein
LKYRFHKAYLASPWFAAKFRGDLRRETRGIAPQLREREISLVNVRDGLFSTEWLVRNRKRIEAALRQVELRLRDQETNRKTTAAIASEASRSSTKSPRLRSAKGRRAQGRQQ